LNRLYINTEQPVAPEEGRPWVWPIDAAQYVQTPDLRPDEKSALAYCTKRQRIYGHFPRWVHSAILPMLQPFQDILSTVETPQQARSGVLSVLILELQQRGVSYWVWTEQDWLSILCSSTKEFKLRFPRLSGHSRHFLFVSLYLLSIFDDFRNLGIIDRTALASRIFGRPRVNSGLKRIIDLVRSWGYGNWGGKGLQWAICTVLLANKSPRLEELTLAILAAERDATSVHYRIASITLLSRALAALGILPQPLAYRWTRDQKGHARNGIDGKWLKAIDRWQSISTLQKSSRKRHYFLMLKAGRWITATHPNCVDPAQWTREIAAEWVALVCRMQLGDWTQANKGLLKNFGKPLSAKAKAHHLSSLCALFRDLQEWELIPRRFDPRRSFAAPRSVRAAISPDPRVIADDIWAKLLWAGMNLKQEDLSTSHDCANHYYPLSMVRALTMTWLFCGLRSDEIRRLRVGCMKQQWIKVNDTPREICDLSVPVNKTSKAFTKPVDRLVREATEVWESERTEQPLLLDEKTGEMINFLFAYRGKQIAQGYINNSLVPALCKKAGIPSGDARGNITSHRARSTIASQLFNAKEPMSLFELQKWLGHKWANSTQHYLAISTTKLEQSYRDAGYFSRNLRMIEVLIDRDTVVKGHGAQEPWKYYDLGHGFCTYDFFDECKFRMVCAKCSFYLPKASTEAQLLEGKNNLLRLRQEIPLTEGELAAVDDGIEAMEKLLKQLADVATPAGPTLRSLQGSQLVQIKTQPNDNSDSH